VVELAPAVLPSLLDSRDEGVGEDGEDTVGGGPVRGELHPAGRIQLLEPLGCEVEEAGAKLLGAAGVSGDGRADQVKMFRSFSKKPWWWR
jgi:hypothetical protein